MDINKIKKDLKSDDPSVKRFAAEEIISNNFYDDEIIGIFVNGLTDSDKGFRDIAYQGISNVAPEYSSKAAGLVAELITKRDIEVRNLAGEILMNAGEPARDALLEYVNNEDQDVRKFAIDILGIISSDKEVLDTIMARLDDTDSNVVLSVIEAAGNIVEKNPDLCSESLMSVCRNKYENDYEAKAFIIECAGKINRPEASDFMINILETEEDEFLQIACIDSLANNAEDEYIIKKLTERIYHINDSLKPVILKTIIAIAQRIGYEFILPDEIRHIAHNALLDDDEDIRAAGLLALGNLYYKNDIKYLFNEIRYFNPQISEHILYILLNNSENHVIDEFISIYSDELAEEKENDSESELFAFIHKAWLDSTEERKYYFLTKLLDNCIEKNDINIIKAVKILYDLDEEAVMKMINNYADENSERIDILRDMLNFTNI